MNPVPTEVHSAQYRCTVDDGLDVSHSATSKERTRPVTASCRWPLPASISMEIAFVSAASAVALTGWGALVGHWFGERRARSETKRLQASAAAAALVAALRVLQRLTRQHSARMPINAAIVGQAIAELGEVDDRHRHRLPIGMRHVSRSVLDAVGTVFGAVAFAHIRPDTAEFPLEHHTPCGATSPTTTSTSPPTTSTGGATASMLSEFMNYDKWLIKTGRRQASRKQH